MKRKELIIIIIIIAFGVLYHIFESGDANLFMLDGCSVNSRKLLDKKHPNDYTVPELKFDNLKSLDIHNRAGGFMVEPASGNSVIIQPVIRVYHRKKSEAEKIYQKVQLRPENIDGKVSLKVGYNEDYPYQRVRVFFKIQLAGQTELKLFNRYGDIRIGKTSQKITIDSRFGNIWANGIESSLTVTHKHGHLQIDACQGDLQLNVRHAKLRLNDINGDIAVKAWHANIKIDNIMSDSFSLKNVHEDVDISNLSAYNADFSLSHGNLSLNFIKIEDQLTVESNYSNIILEYSKSISPLLNISIYHGEIRNKTAVNLNVYKEKSKYYFSSSEGDPEIIINNSYGDIYLKNKN